MAAAQHTRNGCVPSRPTPSVRGALRDVALLRVRDFVQADWALVVFLGVWVSSFGGFFDYLFFLSLMLAMMLMLVESIREIPLSFGVLTFIHFAHTSTLSWQRVDHLTNRRLCHSLSSPCDHRCTEGFHFA